MCKKQSVSHVDSLIISPHSLSMFAFSYKLVLPIIVTLLLALYTPPSLAGGGSVTINCGGVNDHDAIQNALNSAVAGEVLNLAGNCQLDGRPLFINTSNLTIQGAGEQGNWSTVLSGLTNSDGSPVRTTRSNSTYNVGFSFSPTNETISGVTFKGIKFKSFSAAVDISPSISGNSGFCSQTTVTTGNASNITVADSWLDNNRRDITNFGSSDHLSIVNNLITHNAPDVDIYVQGQLFFCRTDAGRFSWIPAGISASVNISNNTIQDVNGYQPIYVVAINAVIANNSVSGKNIFSGMELGIVNGRIIGNTIDGNGIAQMGIIIDWPNVAFDQPTTVMALLNTVTNLAPFIGVGIVVDSGVSGTVMVNNHFSNIPGGDYLLCDANGSANSVAVANCVPNPFNGLASYNNTVISTNHSTTISNLGTNNEILGPYTPVTGP